MPASLAITPQQLAAGPVQTFNHNGAAVAPHAATQRVGLTTTKLRSVAAISINITRITAASSLGKVTVIVKVGGVVYDRVILYNNTVGANVRVDMWQPSRATANGITIETEDLSTGGTIDYDIHAAAYEISGN